MNKSFIPQTEPFHWEDIPVLNYKETGSHFHKITRQVLFEGSEHIGCQLRYFEIQPGGHSTLERHEHVHNVMILRGKGEALVGNEVRPVDTLDLVNIPPQTWHQFRANRDDFLGFLCMVNCDRDKPHLPTEADLTQLRQDATVGQFIRV